MDRCGRTLLAALSLTLAAGCSTTPDPAASTADLASRPPTREAPEMVTSRTRIGRSIEGRPIEAEVLGDGPDCVLIIASIHGDEPAGTPLVRALGDRLKLEPELLEGRTVVLIPVANPDGGADDRRANARGIDLNRDFPASNRGSRDGDAYRPQPETRAIIEVVTQYVPNRIISIHQPMGCIDYDGPAKPLAKAMADASGLRLRKLGTRPGSLGAWAGADMGVAVVTVELPGKASNVDTEALWRRFGPMLLTAVRATTDDRQARHQNPSR